ncbi:MAG: hypothetical protein LDL53_06935 [Candidatus Hydrogenedens sp.]|nr:hypothetical protein [Candidatus Hydrogenedens sp.]
MRKRQKIFENLSASGQKLEEFYERKNFACEPSAKLRSNFSLIGVLILLKESSDIVQQTSPFLIFFFFPTSL